MPETETVVEPESSQTTDPAQIPLDPAQAQPNPVRRDFLTRLTPERSRLLQAKALAARMAKRQARLAQAQNPAKIGAEIAPNPDKSPTNPADGYTLERLSRVRKQIDQLETMIQTACNAEDVDPGHIDKLASALARLSEIERQLADRPLPGSKRPAQDKPAQGRASILLGLDRGPSKSRVEQE